MTKVCNKHLKEPAYIYGQCIGCELEIWQRENERLRKENKAITETLSNHRESYVKTFDENERYRKALEELNKLIHIIPGATNQYMVHGIIQRALKEGETA